MSRSTLLAVLKHYNVERSRYAYEWLMLNFMGEIPDTIDGETLYEVCPPELRDEIALYFEKPASEEKQ